MRDDVPHAVLAGDLDGAVGRAVVDDHHLDLVDAVDPFWQVGEGLRKRGLFVQARDLDEKLHFRRPSMALRQKTNLAREKITTFASW